jgi:signal transduction histidine kinase
MFRGIIGKLGFSKFFILNNEHMELFSNDTIKSNQYGRDHARPFPRRMNSPMENTTMIMQSGTVDENGTRSPGRFITGTWPQILQKRPATFTSALVHELRNPLTNINLAAEILESGNLTEEQKKFVDIILRGAVRVNSLITDFLNAHRSDEIHSELWPVNDLLDEALAMNNDRILLKNILVIKSYSDKKTDILINKQEVKIALINIIVNAIESMNKNNGILKIRTSVAGEKCIVEIEDNGTGISEVNLTNIFNPYFTSKPNGMGLGLSTTLDILLSNCGTLNVKSEVGSGSCFTISFNKIG